MRKDPVAWTAVSAASTRRGQSAPCTLYSGLFPARAKLAEDLTVGSRDWLAWICRASSPVQLCTLMSSDTAADVCNRVLCMARSEVDHFTGVWSLRYLRLLSHNDAMPSRVMGSCQHSANYGALFVFLQKQQGHDVRLRQIRAHFAYPLLVMDHTRGRTSGFPPPQRNPAQQSIHGNDAQHDADPFVLSPQRVSVAAENFCSRDPASQVARRKAALAIG